ncbi:Hypothetical protein RAK1035_2540 [Roseovarius sp. AK1035]|nr:Hypothetical protein RAK1035_2540 [Roseovarius sp. AK1035]
MSLEGCHGQGFQATIARIALLTLQATLFDGIDPLVDLFASQVSFSASISKADSFQRAKAHFPLPPP